MALLWLLSLGDGAHGLIDIAERSGLAFGRLRDAAEALEGVGLLGQVEEALNCPDGGGGPR
jgi:aminopeptidase-like protein